MNKIRRLCDGRVLVLKTVPLAGLDPADRVDTLNEVLPAVPRLSFESVLSLAILREDFRS